MWRSRSAAPHCQCVVDVMCRLLHAVVAKGPQNELRPLQLFSASTSATRLRAGGPTRVWGAELAPRDLDLDLMTSASPALVVFSISYTVSLSHGMA